MADDSGPKQVTTSDGKTVTVQVDRDLCIGAATCVAVSPKLFALDNEAKAILLDSGNNQESFQTIMDAAKSCPVAAIMISDESGNKVYPA